MLKNLWSGKRFGVLFSILLTAFTAYALLDVFVIPRQYAVVAPDSEAVKLSETTALPRNTERNAQSNESDAQTSQSADADDGQTAAQPKDADESDAQTSQSADMERGSRQDRETVSFGDISYSGNLHAAQCAGNELPLTKLELSFLLSLF